MADVEEGNLTALTVQLLSAYVSNNTLPSSELPSLIEATRAALAGKTAEPEPPAAPAFQPAVSVRKSLASRDVILSLIDGKPYKSLKRHLGSHGLTPREYRERYSLSADYPMVAPGYSEQRREVAKTLGLGRKRAEPAAAEPAPAVVSPEPAPVEAAPVEAAPAKAAPRKVAAKKSTPAPKASVSKPRVKKTAATPAPVGVEEDAAAKKPGRRGRKPATAGPKVAAAPADEA